MRKSFFVFVFTIFAFTIHSQNVALLTFSDVSFGVNHTLPETQEYLFSKGYSYMGKTDFLGELAKKYIFARDPKGNGVQYGVVISEKDGKILQVDIIVESQTNFLAIKKKIRALGYKIDPKWKVDDPFNEKYIMEKHEIYFSTFNDKRLGVCYSITYW